MKKIKTYSDFLEIKESKVLDFQGFFIKEVKTEETPVKTENLDEKPE